MILAIRGSRQNFFDYCPSNCPNFPDGCFLWVFSVLVHVLGSFP